MPSPSFFPPAKRYLTKTRTKKRRRKRKNEQDERKREPTIATCTHQPTTTPHGCIFYGLRSRPPTNSPPPLLTSLNLPSLAHLHFILFRSDPSPLIQRRPWYALKSRLRTPTRARIYLSAYEHIRIRVYTNTTHHRPFYQSFPTVNGTAVDLFLHRLGWSLPPPTSPKSLSSDPP